MKEEDLKDLEKKLWNAANKMIGAVSVANYKFVVLGLIFLKYISDAFEEKYPTASGIRKFASKRAEYIPVMLEMNIPD